MIVQNLLMTGLVDVSLHGDGSYSGYKFCGNFTGVDTAVGQKVTAQGHTTTLKPGKCSSQMMTGQPYIHQAPRFFHTKPDKLKVHWDGRVWCP
mmetsp:Transcript_93407/g.136449  ORF Transcript_93407/g.136449 Transcript_93407/m.136449 type:complete len:93 (+) Transcript_93407:37-315(+)|eukprot:CAMPEP_0179452194 /NCGR_PEP_ID=MMETSP0799-20121207/36098_1 /TAXON_ID=46947 /ORGANISM="Geminigera cryophila, Strain CCMP2564" /LENGTH=92 /DNA_ID=CAMNT_0021247909 /DNA_START=37 /DNA_END=315 /DNA_ORIENTATION=+